MYFLTVTCFSLPARAEEQEDSCSSSSQSKSDSNNHNHHKPTRKELAEALQQHLDILEQRGQVSSVIPSFFHRTARPLEDKVADEVSSISSSVMAVKQGGNKKKRPHSSSSGLIASKYQYYVDLAADLPAHPIPIDIHVPVASQRMERPMSPLACSESDDSKSVLTATSEESSRKRRAVSKG